MNRLRIQLLGGFLLEWDGRPVPPIASRAGRSLFAYLITNRDRAHTRDLLAGLFWPDQPEQRARRRLSQALWQVQSVLAAMDAAEPYVIATPSTLAFNTKAPYWLDVEELEHRLAAAAATDEVSSPDRRFRDLAEGLELYRGDFLAGFYDEWVLVEQRRIREQYLVGMGALLQLSKSRGDYEGALSYAHRLALQDPLREEAHQEVMRLAYLTGRVNEALQQYEHCRSILLEELGVEPSPDTQALHLEISARTERGARPFTPAPDAPLLEGPRSVPFVGREEERSSILSRMEEAIGGRGGLILLEGESGVGKTRLLTQLTDDAHWRGLGVLWGDCTTVTSPFEAVTEALSRELSDLRARQLAQVVEGVWLREVVELMPTIGEYFDDLPERVPLRPQEESDRMRHAFSQLLFGLASINPYLIVIDDLHSSDRDSLKLIETIAPRLSGIGLLLCVSYRGEEARRREEVWETLTAIDRVEGASRLVLTPLSEVETAQLVRRSLGLSAVSQEATQLLYKDTGGNPLFTLETLRAIRDLEETDAAAFLEGAGPLPAREELPIAGTVQEVVSDRLRALPEGVRATLDLVAVHGERTPLDVLTATTDQTDLLSHVDELIGRGLMGESQGRLQFSHSQIRRVAYEELADDRRRSLHLRLGNSLERTELGSPSDLARHFTAARSWSKAVSYHRRAAEAAAEILAHETSADHYQAAAKHARRARLSTESHFELLADFEDVLEVLGRRKSQAKVIETLEELVASDARRTIDVRLREARWLGGSGELESAVRSASEALSQAEDLGDADRSVAALTALGTYLIWAGRSSEAVRTLRGAVETAGDKVTPRAKAYLRLGSALSDTQDYPAAREALSKALLDYEEGGNVRGRAEALGALAIAHMETGDTKGAEGRYREALELCRRMGYRHGEGVNLVNLANLQYVSGRVGEALQHYEQAAATFHAIGDRRGEAMVLGNSASVRANLLGDFDGATRGATRALDYFTEIEDRRGRAQCLSVLASVARQRGDLPEAFDLLSQSLHLSEESKHQWITAHLQRDWAQTALMAGDPDEAEQVATEAIALCDRLGLSDLRVRLLSTSAEASLARGDVEMARQKIDEAVQGLGLGVDRPHLVWLARYLILLATGDEVSARRALEQAHLALEDCLSGLGDAERRISMEQVPEHRAIEEAWSSSTPSSVRRTLARKGAPTGRALRDDERVEVTWTVSTPPSGSWAKEPELRREAIVLLLGQADGQGAEPTVADLAEALEVSSVTVRRDLARLRAEGAHPITRGSRPRP